MQKEYRVLDLFAGCGGFSIGFKSASSKFRIVAAIDFEEKATTNYNYNLNKNRLTRVFTKDLTQFGPVDLELAFNGEELEFDVIIGGPPCPGFSNIGRSKIMGLIKSGNWKMSEERHMFIEDPRNKLFYEFVKYVEYFQPEIFIFENVKGLGSYKQNKNGSVQDMISVIENEFNDVGYHTDHELLNSARYGVPQNRERYFIVGIKKSLSNHFDFDYPDKTHVERKEIIETGQQSLNLYFNETEKENSKEGKLPEVMSIQAIFDLPRFENIIKDNIDITYKSTFEVNKVIEEFRSAYSFDKYIRTYDEFPEMAHFLETIKNQNDELTVCAGDPSIINCHYPRPINDLGDEYIFPQLKTERTETFIYGDLDPKYKRLGDKGFEDKMRRIPWWRPSWTIIAHLKIDGYMFIHPHRVPPSPQHRSITAREAARLQSFPDSYDFSAGGEIARGYQFQQIGNAVPPLLAKALARSTLKWFNSKGL